MTTNRGIRTAVRISSFSAAIVLALGISSYTNWKRAEKAELALEYQYLKGINDLGTYLENIENSLAKSMYVGTSETMTQLASRLRQESSQAKECLSSLPVGSLNLEKTYKYLSQLGEYSVSLGKKMENGQTLTTEEYQTLTQMKDYADQFLQYILVIEDAMRTGTLSFDEVVSETSMVASSPVPYYLADGFNEMEHDGLASYPTLIYDGPFSDHILTKKPSMLEGLQEVSREQAREVAAKASSLAAEQMYDDTDEEGNMPSWCFKAEDIYVAVTKQGGLLSYFIKDRIPEQENKSAEECIYLAQNYLEALGITGLKYSYYEIDNNIITINFASTEGDVICYTDLIKVSVAMDNGEILRYDARGYIANHHTRDNLVPAISVEQAQKSLSPLLTVSQVNTAVIPTDSLGEAFCYEFDCSSQTGEHVLVYINAQTGAEEKILVVYTDEKGTLTL